MSPSHRVGELLRKLAGLFCLLGLCLQAPAQTPGASAQPNAAPSSDPTLTQQIRPDGSISSVWKNPDGTLLCTSEFTNYGNGKTKRFATVFRKDGTVYYQNTYTTNSDGSAISEFQYPDPTHRTNGAAVTLTINPDGTVRESSGSKSYEQPATAQATSTAAPVPATPGSTGATSQSSSPITVTVTGTSGASITLQLSPTNPTSPQNVSGGPSGAPGTGKAFVFLTYEEPADQTAPSSGSGTATSRSPGDIFAGQNWKHFADSGIAEFSSQSGTFTSPGIQFGNAFIFTSPLDTSATYKLTVYVPQPAPSATPSGPSTVNLSALTNMDTLKLFPFVTEFNCPSGSGCVTTPSLDLTVNSGPGGPTITSVSPGGQESRDNFVKFRQHFLDNWTLNKEPWVLLGTTQTPGGSPQPNAPASSGEPTLTQSTNADGTLSSVWRNPDGTIQCTSVLTDHGGGNTTRVAQCYQNGALYYTSTYTTSSDGSSKSELVYATGEKIIFIANADGSLREVSGASSSGTTETVPANSTVVPIITSSPTRYTLTPTLKRPFLTLQLRATNLGESNASTTPAPRQNIFADPFGFPLWKEKTFFFLSYESARNRSTLFSDPGAAMLTARGKTLLFPGIQVGKTFVYALPSNPGATNDIRIQLPVSALMLGMNLNDFPIDVYGLSGSPGATSTGTSAPVVISRIQFTCPEGSGCTTTPGLNFTLQSSSAGLTIENMTPVRGISSFGDDFVRDTWGVAKLGNFNAGASSPNAPPSEHQLIQRAGAGRYAPLKPDIQIRGFGGVSFINGNTPGAAGFDGAVLFPLGNRVLIGPTAGFQWINSSIIKTIGGGPPPSTFIRDGVEFKNGNFGARVAFPFGGWQLGIHGGATVAGSTLTQATGFCGNGTPTGGPAGCTITSSSARHDIVVDPFVGAFVSHSIFSHVGVFTEFDYSHLKDGSVLDVSNRSVEAGISVRIPNFFHHAKGGAR